MQVIGRGEQRNGRLERQVQRLTAINVEGRQLPLPCITHEAAGGLQLHRESHGLGVQAQDVICRRAIDTQIECGKCALADCEISRVQIDLRDARCAHVKGHLRIDAVERHAVMVNAPAVRVQRERRLQPRSAQAAVGMQLSAAVGRQETHIGRIERELQRKFLRHFAVERKIGLAERESHRIELPGFAAACEPAAAMRGEPAQTTRDSAERDAEIGTARKAGAVGIESKVERARKVAANPARIDAGGVAADRPALPGRPPDDFACDIRLSVKRAYACAADDEPVFRQLRIHFYRHRRKAAYRDQRGAAQSVGPHS